MTLRNLPRTCGLTLTCALVVWVHCLQAAESYEHVASEQQVASSLVDGAEAVCAGGRSIVVKKWNQRTGNNLVQITNAIMLAKWSRTPQVELPEQRGPSDEVFVLPKCIRVDVAEEGDDWWNRTFACVHATKDSYFDAPCRARDPDSEAAAWNTARSKVMLETLWPWVRHQFKECPEPDASTLTVHGRYGDCGAFRPGDHFPEGKLYPCSFYDRLIDTYSFRRVLFLVEERDAEKHPCIGTLQRRQDTAGDIALDVVTSFAGAVCNIAKASNLVIPLSTFSKTLVFANQRVSRIFTSKRIIKTKGLHMRIGFQSFSGACQKGSAEVYEYDLQGLDQKHTKREKLRYMRSNKLNMTSSLKRCLL